jgi:hypothetical protein
LGSGGIGGSGGDTAHYNLYFFGTKAPGAWNDIWRDKRLDEPWGSENHAFFRIVTFKK